MVVGLILSGWGLARRRSVWSVGGVALSAVCAVALTGYVFGLSNQLPDASSGASAVNTPWSPALGSMLMVSELPSSCDRTADTLMSSMGRKASSRNSARNPTSDSPWPALTDSEMPGGAVATMARSNWRQNIS